MKKYLILPLLIAGGLTQSAYAAKFSIKDYLLNSDRKSGIFVGIDYNANTTKYYSNYYQSGFKDAVDVNNLLYDTKNVSDAPYTLIYGARFYLPMKKSKWSNVGIGFKGWYSTVNNDFTRQYYGTGTTNETLTINADLKTIGYEGQLYFDLLNFKTAKIAHSVGFALGAGYEKKAYSNYTISRETQSPVLSKITTSFDFGSVIYDASVYYTFANRHRLEAGYKIADYGSNTQQVSAPIGGATYVADSEVTPLNKYYYLSYSFQF